MKKNDPMLNAVRAAMPAINKACSELAAEASRFLRERLQAEAEARLKAMLERDPDAGCYEI